ALLSSLLLSSPCASSAVRAALSLHDALPISASRISRAPAPPRRKRPARRAASSPVIAKEAVAANTSSSGAVHPEVAVLRQPANGGARGAAREPAPCPLAGAEAVWASAAAVRAMAGKRA